MKTWDGDMSDIMRRLREENTRLKAENTRLRAALVEITLRLVVAEACAEAAAKVNPLQAPRSPPRPMSIAQEASDEQSPCHDRPRLSNKSANQKTEMTRNPDNDS